VGASSPAVAVIGFPRAAVRKICLSPPIQRIAILTFPDRMMQIALHDSKPNDRVIISTDSGNERCGKAVFFEVPFTQDTK
jgi:hypothetical protein